MCVCVCVWLSGCVPVHAFASHPPHLLGTHAAKTSCSGCTLVGVVRMPEAETGEGRRHSLPRVKEPSAEAVLTCRRRKPLDKGRASRAGDPRADVSGSTPYGQHSMPFERNRRHRWSWQDKSQSHGNQPSSMRHVSAHLLLRAPTAGRLLASTAELPRPLRRCSVKVRPPKRCALPSPRGPERHDLAAHFPRRVAMSRRRCWRSTSY